MDATAVGADNIYLELTDTTVPYLTVVADLTVSDETINFSEAELTTRGDIIWESPFSSNCTKNQYLILQNYEFKCVDFPENKEIQMFTISNILLIAIIAFVVAKWVVPKLTLKAVFRGLIRLLLKPFKRTKEQSASAWRDAKLKERF